MGLKMKTLSNILGDTVNWVNKSTNRLTDFNIGSVSRTLLEAVSLQIEELYFKMYENFMWAVENSIFKAFGFEIIDASHADGYITIEFTYPLASPHQFTKNLKFCTSPGVSVPKYYVSTKDVVAPIGATKIMLPVSSLEPGDVGNTPAHSIVILTTPNSQISKVYNPYALDNGREKETKAERKARFLQFILTLARGTADAIVYGASQVEGVKGVWVDDSEIGLVRVFAHDSNGDLSKELKDKLMVKVSEYKAAGVEVTINPVIKHAVDVDVKVLISKDYDSSLYESIISEAIKNYLTNFQVNQNLYVTDLIQYLMNLDDIAIISVDIDSPVDNIIANKQQLIRPGSINVAVKSIE